MKSRKIPILLAVGTLTAWGAAPAVAARTPKVPIGASGNGKLRARPANIIYTGDGSAFLAGARRSHHRAGHLRWTSWSAKSAHGSGFNWVDNCQPNCAAGKFATHPVKLHLWRPERVAGHLVFTRMRVTYVRRHRRELWKVVHDSLGFYWNLPPR